ncbi:MAG TPA: hypothetical protein VGM70_02225 [Pseudolysinimonas sp.]
MSEGKNFFRSLCTWVDSAVAGRYELWSLLVTEPMVPKVGPPIAATASQMPSTITGARMRSQRGRGFVMLTV